ncbi:DUF4349 domain-containing protein [candidate division WWE3 bacterium]|uniref:DUF4349 domain-containing protein n=1 Tax=candidate division WWE3 bacterium TaxID=2053526 RepID=A0A7X9HGT8_UNCKA|nr:DUF4349 domain-containing protein [candidate division WWE3 bacterium]
MIKRLFNWIKSNKLTFFLMIVVVLMLLGRSGGVKPLLQPQMYGIGGSSGMGFGVSNSIGLAPKMVSDTYYEPNPVAPRPDITERKLVTNTSFSLLVKDVTQTLTNIKTKIQEVQGYMVNIQVSRPELGENATVSFRVPSTQVDNITTFLREQAIKVVSEDISGYDVTDEYVNVQEYLAILTKNKTRMEEILNSAKTVDEMLKVQNQLFSIQSQIDSYQGQLKYMEGTTSTSLITAYISTDETGLPYTEPLSWRPEVIFKHAVRSLYGTLQGVGTALIWLGVYSVLIVPALTIVLIIVIIVKRKNKQQ